MRIAGILGIVSSLFLLLAPAYAAAECSSVLQKTEIYSNSNISTKLALLSLVDESNYDQVSHDASASAPISGVAPFSGSYNDFEQKRSSLLKKYNLDFTHESARSYLTQYLPHDVVQAWLGCETHNEHSQYGFHAWASAVSDDAITIEFLWKPTGIVVGKTDFMQLQGVKPGAPAINQVWATQPTTGQTITYQRMPKQRFVLNISVNGIPQHVEAIAQVARPPEVVFLDCGQFVSNAVATAHEDGQRDGHAGPDATSHTLPFPSYTVGTNSDVIYGGVALVGKCDSAGSTSTTAFERVTLSEHGVFDFAGRAGPAYWANAHWSPTWNATLKLPENDTRKPYKLTVTFENSMSNNLALNDCTLSANDKLESFPNGQLSSRSVSLSPGDYQLALNCSRSRTDTNWDEEIRLSLNLSRP